MHKIYQLLHKTNKQFNISIILQFCVYNPEHSFDDFRDLYNYIVKANFNAESIFNQQNKPLKVNIYFIKYLHQTTKML